LSIAMSSWSRSAQKVNHEMARERFLWPLWPRLRAQSSPRQIRLHAVAKKPRQLATKRTHAKYQNLILDMGTSFPAGWRCTAEGDRQRRSVYRTLNLPLAWIPLTRDVVLGTSRVCDQKDSTPGERLLRCGISSRRMTANGMVRPRGTKDEEQRCHPSLILKSPWSVSISAKTRFTSWITQAGSVKIDRLTLLSPTRRPELHAMGHAKHFERRRFLDRQPELRARYWWRRGWTGLSRLTMSLCGSRDRPRWTSWWLQQVRPCCPRCTCPCYRTGRCFQCSRPNRCFRHR